MGEGSVCGSIIIGVLEVVGFVRSSSMDWCDTDNIQDRGHNIRCSPSLPEAEGAV